MERVDWFYDVPFFNRTTDTLVNLIWLDGWLIGILKT